MSERAVPFYCPYCGEEDLEPYEGDGTWHCRGCVRAFRLRFVGLGALDAGSYQPHPERTQRERGNQQGATR